MALEVKSTIVLSEKEENFCLALCRGLRPSAAAISAGYAISSARNLLRQRHIAAAVKALTANLLYVCRRIDEEAARVTD